MRKEITQIKCLTALITFNAFSVGFFRNYPLVMMTSFVCLTLSISFLADLISKLYLEIATLRNHLDSKNRELADMEREYQKLVKAVSDYYRNI